MFYIFFIWSIVLLFTVLTARTSGGVIVSKLDSQTYMSEFKSHVVLHPYGIVSHLNKKLSKLHPCFYLKMEIEPNSKLFLLPF